MSDAPSLYKLLATYWERYDALDRAMKATDGTSADAPARKRAEAAQARSGDRLDDALVDICRFEPAWLFEARLKADFIRQHVATSGSYLERTAIEALLDSMSRLTTKAGGTT